MIDVKRRMDKENSYPIMIYISDIETIDLEIRASNIMCYTRFVCDMCDQIELLNLNVKAPSVLFIS